MVCAVRSARLSCLRPASAPPVTLMPTACHPVDLPDHRSVEINMFVSESRKGAGLPVRQAQGPERAEGLRPSAGRDSAGQQSAPAFDCGEAAPGALRNTIAASGLTFDFRAPTSR